MDELDWLDDDGTDDREHPGMADVPQEINKRVLKMRGRRRPAALIRADRALTPQQRLYKDLVASTTSSYEANAAFDRVYPGKNRTTLWRWRQSKQFVHALELTYDHLCKLHGVSRESLVHRLEQIRDDALAPKPILFKGEPTGYYENNPQHALKAIEQQSKLLGLYEEEVSRVAVDLRIDFGGYGEEQVIEGEAEVIE